MRTKVKPYITSSGDPYNYDINRYSCVSMNIKYEPATTSTCTVKVISFDADDNGNGFQDYNENCTDHNSGTEGNYIYDSGESDRIFSPNRVLICRSISTSSPGIYP